MTKIIFLQKEITNNLELTSNVNIILSPEFYWVRIFDIPITSKKEALGVVPNLFEDFFDVEGYKFYIIKLDEHRYLSFAYREQDILDSLQNNNIDYKKVSNIYFSQNEFTKNQSFQIDENKFLYKDEILVKIPTNMKAMFDTVELDISKIELSKDKISINQSSKYIDRTSAYILSTIFILFSLVVFSKTYSVNQQINLYPIKIEKLKKDYNLMSSMIQTKSVLKQFDKISKKHNNSREVLAYIINFKQKVSGTLKNLEFKNGTIYCTFLDTNFQNMKKYIQKKYKITESNSKDKVVKIGIKI